MRSYSAHILIIIGRSCVRIFRKGVPARVVAIISSKINRSTVKRMDIKDKSIRRQVGEIMVLVPVMTHSSLELRQLGRSHKTD